MQRSIVAKAFTCIQFLFIAFFAQAQILKPVTWEFSSEKTGLNEYTLVFKATIDEGWKIYGTDVGPGGPIPTSVNFETEPAGVDFSKPLEALGRKEVAVEPLFDNMTVSMYKKKL
ncbi:MAG: sugar transporter, partial [Chitinophagales bacterium]